MTEKEEPQVLTLSLPVFTFPLDLREKLKRADVEVRPETYITRLLLSSLRELLLHIEDYELVRKVCNVEGKGINDLFMGIQEVIPRYFVEKNLGEYPSFLHRLEQLSLEYLAYISRGSDYGYSRPAQKEVHSQSLLVYALAIGVLGETAYYYAMGVLECYQYYRVRDIEGLGWVRSQLNICTRYGISMSGQDRQYHAN